MSQAPYDLERQVGADEGADREEPDRPESLFVVKHPQTMQLGLACAVKRTYSIGPRGLSLADDQLPLRASLELGFDEAGHYVELLDDVDLVAPKVATDVVVLGSAHPGAPTREAFVAVAVGSSARRLVVRGERRARVKSDGSVTFSSAEPFTVAKLSLALAYGGWDARAQDLLELEVDRLAQPTDGRPKARGLFAYARNEAGVGFYLDVERERADGAPLPRIEDPADVLTPERFFVPSVVDWVDAPLPGNLGFVPHSCFPRFARLLGPVLPHRAPARPLREAQLGDGDDLASLEMPEAGVIHPRALQGAAPGLARERLRGDERVILQGLVAGRPEVTFSLPGEAPSIEFRAPDIRAFSSQSVLQTVRLEPDAGRVSLVWCATVPLAYDVDDEFLTRTEAKIAWSRL